MKKIYFVSFLFVIVSCNNKNGSKADAIEKENVLDYTLVADDDSIMAEVFDATVTDENKYNNNNIIFTVGSEFEYRFAHKDKDGNTFYFKRNTDDFKKWEFVPQQERDSLTIKSILIKVENGNPMAQHIPDYNQTVISYRMGDGKSFSTSGVIENKANVWMHPPRDAYFRILELNPFPYIQAPYQEGHSWQWQLDIGSVWGDERWKTWEGGITNNYTYTITSLRNIYTEFGEIECYEIQSNAESRIGSTSLISYFHPKLGFVRLLYTNIDGSTTTLELMSKT